MGIWRINTILYEEYDSPADRRVRIETDIPIRDKAQFEALRRALANDNYPFVQGELLARVRMKRARIQVSKEKRPTNADLHRVAAVIHAAFEGRSGGGKRGGKGGKGGGKRAAS
jgi:hypothetical protein